jgi:phasin family protein
MLHREMNPRADKPRADQRECSIMAKADETTNRNSAETLYQNGRTVGAVVPDLEPLFQAGNKLLEGWMAVGTELLEFSRSRLDQNIEMGKAIAQSGSINEAMDLQARFTRDAMQDYLTEANKLADLGTRSFFESFNTLQRPVQEGRQQMQAAE